MTDKSTDKSTDDLPPAEELDLIGWMASGTIATRQVVLFNDTTIAARFERLDDQRLELEERVEYLEALLEEARVETKDADAPLAGPAPRTVADDVADELATAREAVAAHSVEYERVKAATIAARTEWSVRAMSAEEVKQSFDVHPDPKTPIPPKNDGNRVAIERFEKRIQEYTRGKAEAEHKRRLWLVAQAVQSVESASGATTLVTEATLQGIYARPHGAMMIDKLYRAVEACTDEDVELKRPI